jgi:hypothetical protein
MFVKKILLANGRLTKSRVFLSKQQLFVLILLIYALGEYELASFS